ncbi:hypothetical protein E2C01_102617 [Portunus trituberculatus]|uniref:Uncharacterized protein n=1 Tax=Portunus trituberculatus TaxID=210409 RepID=A0A5B7KN84_PORTR|nr:hypothetical protein [Portunus trituberculatus]
MCVRVKRREARKQVGWTQLRDTKWRVPGSA